LFEKFQYLQKFHQNKIMQIQSLSNFEAEPKKESVCAEYLKNLLHSNSNIKFSIKPLK